MWIALTTIELGLVGLGLVGLGLVGLGANTPLEAYCIEGN